MRRVVAACNCPPFSRVLCHPAKCTRMRQMHLERNGIHQDTYIHHNFIHYPNKYAVGLQTKHHTNRESKMRRNNALWWACNNEIGQADKCLEVANEE